PGAITAASSRGCWRELGRSGAATGAHTHAAFVSPRLHVDPLVGPVRNRVDGGRQGSSLLRQRIFDANRRLRANGAFDNALLLELLEPLAEHAVRDIGNRRAKRGESAP